MRTDGRPTEPIGLITCTGGPASAAAAAASAFAIAASWALVTFGTLTTTGFGSATFLAGLTGATFLATGFLVALAGAFFAGAFLAGAFLAGVFLAGAFLAAAFFAIGAFLAGAFLAGAFLAALALVVAFLAGFAAMVFPFS